MKKYKVEIRVFGGPWSKTEKYLNSIEEVIQWIYKNKYNESIMINEDSTVIVYEYDENGKEIKHYESYEIDKQKD